MALVNPNIAMGYRGIELPNQLAQYGMVSQIQNAQNQNRMANMQMQEYERARGEEEGLRNFLAKADFAKPETRTGLFQFGKTGREYAKTLAEQEISAATLANTKSQTAERDYKLSQEKLKHGWESLGSAGTPQEAVEKILDGVKKGYFDQATAEAEIGKIPQDPGQYKQYRIEKVMGLLDAKDKLAGMLPNITRQDVGSQVVNIQNNPALPGYGMPVQNMAAIPKTMTPGDVASNKVAQANLALNREKFNFDQTTAGQSVTYQQDANGNIVALPTKVRPGDVPRGRTVAAPGAGMTPMAGKPSEAAAKETASLNQQNAIIKGALDAIEKNPDAFGTPRGVAGGVLGETFGARAVGETPEETQARSFLFNVVSGVIKERAGTAQSAGEQATLNRFLPTTTDNSDELTSKLKGFQDYLTARESAGKKPGGRLPPSAGVDTSNPLLK